MKPFQTLAKITLTLTYMVVIAGAVVRMTGSGMGCPDWPKCFGYYIPPTQEVQLRWRPHQPYKKGQVIITSHHLRVSIHPFTSTENFSKINWKPYTEHDSTTFNPLHTWVEYINRLLGVLAGLSTLLLAATSVKFWKKNKTITIIAFLTVFGMGFQAWLGKTVVNSNLAPFKITIHMVMALVLISLLLYLVYVVSPRKHRKRQNLFRNVLIVATILTVTQIILGTQVRQFIDNQIKLLGDHNNRYWLSHPTVAFYIHRSFSLAVLAANASLLYLSKKHCLNYKKLRWIVAIVIVEIACGASMAYFYFPFGTQPLHLVLASLLFGCQYYLILETSDTPKMR